MNPTHQTEPMLLQLRVQAMRLIELCDTVAFHQTHQESSMSFYSPGHAPYTPRSAWARERENVGKMAALMLPTVAA
jgi:hypothetical protein